MRRRFFLGVAWNLFAASPVCSQLFQTQPDLATVETTADGSVHGGLLDGTSEVLNASGAQDAILIRFRTSLIEKWIVKKAVIAFHTPEGTAPPAEVMLSGVAAKWSEGSTAPPELGQGWKKPTHALKDGWVTVELPPEIAQELASGKWATVSMSPAVAGILSVHSRRSGQFMPYLLVRGQRP